MNKLFYNIASGNGETKLLARAMSVHHSVVYDAVTKILFCFTRKKVLGAFKKNQSVFPFEKLNLALFCLMIKCCMKLKDEWISKVLFLSVLQEQKLENEF